MISNKPFRPVEILIVDDSNSDIRLLQEYFKDDNMVYHRLNVVKDGIDALKYLRKESEYIEAITPDIVLLDLYMPKMDGRETLKAIREDIFLKDIVIGIMTTTESEAESLNLEKMPSTFYILKPVDVYKFLDLMHRAEDYLADDLKVFCRQIA